MFAGALHMSVFEYVLLVPLIFAVYLPLFKPHFTVGAGSRCPLTHTINISSRLLVKLKCCWVGNSPKLCFSIPSATIVPVPTPLLRTYRMTYWQRRSGSTVIFGRNNEFDWRASDGTRAASKPSFSCHKGWSLQVKTSISFAVGDLIFFHSTNKCVLYFPSWARFTF